MRINLDTISMSELMAGGGRLLVVAALQSMPYKEYLLTNHWQSIRKRTQRVQMGRCALCRDWIHDIHHVDYENRGQEEYDDVVGLCRRHHEKWHRDWVHRSEAEVAS